MFLSVHTQLRQLEDLGVVEKRRDPSIHLLPGEGRMFYKGNKVEFLTNVKGPAPDGSDIVLEELSDVAWCPRTKTLLAYAPTENEPFQLPKDGSI
jgi:hypothetical protein